MEAQDTPAVHTIDGTPIEALWKLFSGKPFNFFMTWKKVKLEMNFIIKLAMLICSLCLSLVLAEGAAQVYVNHVVMQTKLFKPDSVLGWKMISNLDTKRRNSDGEIWTIKTDENGIRGNARWDSHARKVLVAGDSFAFGDGVNIEDRFDALIGEKGYQVITLGVIGYGTDQALIMAKPYYENLNAGDIFIIMTCYNDFWDIAKQWHSGRSKVWYELIDENLVKHDPVVTWSIKLRDKSYLWSKASSLFGSQEFTAEQILQASRIYDSLLSADALELKRKGVRVLLAYFGLGNIPERHLRKQLEDNIIGLCEKLNITCIPVDNRLPSQENCFLKDGHWNKKGNYLVGKMLLDEIDQVQ